MQNRTFLLGFLFTLLCMPGAVFAAGISVYADQDRAIPGHEVVSQILFTGDESFNALEGVITYPADRFTLKEIRDGDSILSLWIEHPHLERAGRIKFSGAIPGGLLISQGHVFSLVLSPKKEGDVVLGSEGVRVFPHDGSGISYPAVFLGMQYTRERDDSLFLSSTPDIEPPEPFSLFVGSQKDLFSGRYFVAFDAADKNSGIAYYQVREGLWGGYRAAKSPYVLHDQKLTSSIFVKAVDKAGNVRIVEKVAEHPVQDAWYVAKFFSILVVVLIALTISWKKYKR